MSTHLKDWLETAKEIHDAALQLLPEDQRAGHEHAGDLMDQFACVEAMTMAAGGQWFETEYGVTLPDPKENDLPKWARFFETMYEMGVLHGRLQAMGVLGALGHGGEIQPILAVPIPLHAMPKEAREAALHDGYIIPGIVLQSESAFERWVTDPREAKSEPIH